MLVSLTMPCSQRLCYEQPTDTRHCTSPSARQNCGQAQTPLEDVYAIDVNRKLDRRLLREVCEPLLDPLCPCPF